MREAEISAEHIRSVLEYRPATGVFVWRSRTGRGARNDLAGTAAGAAHNDGYTAIQIGPRKYLAHRLAWLYTFGLFPEGDIDHLNGVRTDNRIVNLRDATRAINAQNRRLRNGRLGIDFVKRTKKWRARIGVEGRSEGLGSFESKAAAQAAYLRAKRALHRGNTL